MSYQPARLSRRQFIRMTAIAGLVTASGGLLFNLARSGPRAERIQETRMLLGSIAHLTVISADRDRARSAVVAAFDRMAALEDVFSRFRPHSQLSLLNTAGSLSDPHPELKTVLTKAVWYGDLTGGAFDVTIEPVLRRYRQSAVAGTLPNQEQIAAARQLVDYRQIEIADDMIRLNWPGMAITLDGIAKGYIIDAGVAVLREFGFEQVLVELGGDLQTYGNAATHPWQVTIQQPTGMVSGPPIIAQLVRRAMATSGDYQYTFTPDRRLNHILDPHTGVSPDELSSATVVAPTACDADALATSLMVMGADAGLAMITVQPDAEALVISKSGVVRRSVHFPA